MLPFPTMTTKTKISQISLLMMLLMLLLAATLRIVQLSEQSIWFDEAFAWNIIVQGDMYPRISTDTHPPLYYLLLRGWTEVAGDSALTLRYLSALTSLLTVATVMAVGRELATILGGSRTASTKIAVPILAGLMLALSDAEIFLAQETRNYAMYSFLATFSMWTYLRWLSRPGKITALWWSGSLAALMYTHYQGIFIPAIQGVHVLLFLRGRKRIEGVGALVLSGLLVLPWFVGVTIPQAKNAIDNSLPFAIPSNWETFLHLRDNYLGDSWALLLVLAGVGLWGLITSNNQHGKGTSCRAPTKNDIFDGHRGSGRTAMRPYKFDTFFLVFMWFALPFGVLWVGNTFAALLTERKLLIVAPAIALMVGFGLGQLRNPARALLVLAILLYSLTSVDYYRVKEPWDEIAAAPLPYMQSSDLALVEAGVGQYAMKYYWEHWLPDGAIFTTRAWLGDPTISPTADWYTYYNALLPDLMAESQSRRIGDVATAWLVWWGGEQMMLDSLANNGYLRTMTLPFDHLGNTIRLFRYDHLPETARAEYSNGLILRGAEIDAAELRVDLWWSVDEQLPADYTTSVMLLDASGIPVAQKDSPPYFGERPTSSWQTGEVIFDPKTLELVDGAEVLPSGEYTVIVKVYLWSPEGIVDVGTVDEAPWVEVGMLEPLKGK
jgi:uncharacterized membrane protein